MRWPFVLALSVGLAPVFACGGGGDKISEEEAQDIADAALLVIGDLPGNGWEETARDEADEDDSNFPDTDACEALNELISEEDDDDGELVTTNVTFGRAPRNQAETALEVQAELVVHEGTAEDRDLADEFAEILEESQFNECMEDFLQQTAAEIGGRGEYRERDPSADPPRNGAALAFEFSLEAQGARFEAAAEMYFWNRGHVESQLFLFGPPELMKADFIEEVLEKAEDRVNEAQEE